MVAYITPGPVRYSMKNVAAFLFMLLCLVLAVNCFADIKNHTDPNIHALLIFLGCDMLLGAGISIPFIKKEKQSW